MDSPCRLSIEYHVGPPIEVDPAKILQYEVQKGQRPQDPDRVVDRTVVRPERGYEYLAELMLDDRPLVLGSPGNGHFDAVISLKGVKQIRVIPEGKTTDNK